MGKIEILLYQERPFEIDILKEVETRGKIYISPSLLRLLKKRKEDLSNLRVSRYDDINMFIELEVREDATLEPHQIRLFVGDLIKLNYGEGFWEGKNLRLILGENNKVFKDLLLTDNSMSRAREVLDRGYLKYRKFSEEEKRAYILEIDKHLLPAVNMICRNFYKLKGSVKEAARDFLHRVSFLIQDVRRDLPPEMENVRVYEGLKEYEIAIHPFFLIDYPAKRAEVCIVHPILGENFFEQMDITSRKSLKLYETGFSKEFLERRGIPFPPTGKMRLGHSISYLDGGADPEDLEFSL